MFKRPSTSLAVLALVLSAAACSSNNSGGGDGGTAGKGGAVTDAAPDTGVFGVLCPLSPMRLTTSPPMTAEQFCTVYLLACNGGNTPDGGYTARADCEAAYAALNFDSTRQCRSYHVCNAANYDTTNAALHCQHSIGIVLCDDVSPDASQ
jgi:hypothetical protein